MTIENDILDGVIDKYGEWIEHAGEESPVLIMHILCTLIKHQKDEIEYLKKRLKS
jgi:hypothetical protein